MNEIKYEQLVKDIRKKIIAKEYTVDEKIPSENQLSAMYGISRQTVRKGILELTNQGYLYAVHGKGTFVSKRINHEKKTRNIAVVLTYLSDYIFPRVIQGIERVLTENGYSILLKTTGNSRAAEARCIEELLSKGVDGMIIEPSKSEIFCNHSSLYEQMQEYDIPFVFIQGCFLEMMNYPYVLMDDARGGYMITKHLVELGHRRILGIFKSDDIQGKNRHKGYVQALQEAGIMYNPDDVIWFHTEDRKIKPRETIGMLLNTDAQFDAVVCYNDQIAVEIIRTIREHGKNVPQDIAVTGFDNSLLAKNNKIPITTISHPQERLGMKAAELMMKFMRNESMDEKDYHILIEPELVIRESTNKNIK